jgi:RNA polymerase sigma factor (sigma-70 family)
MAKIYFKNEQGKRIAVEVSNEVAKNYREILQEEWRGNAYESYYTTSLERITVRGHDFEDKSRNVEEEFLDKERKQINKLRLNILHKAIDSLLPEQKELLRQVYSMGISQRKIAENEGVDESTISKRMERIYRRLKKFFEKNEN